MNEKQIELFSKLSIDKSNKFYSTYKQLLLIATGLFSLLVSIQKEYNYNIYEKYSFAISLISLGLGILNGCIFLFSESDISTNAQANLLKQIQRQAKSGIPTDKIIFGEPLKIYLICKKISYISFVLSLISLIWYAIQLNH